MGQLLQSVGGKGEEMEGEGQVDRKGGRGRGQERRQGWGQERRQWGQERRQGVGTGKEAGGGDRKGGRGWGQERRQGVGTERG